MKLLGSYKKYDEILADFRMEIDKICKISMRFNDFLTKDILIFSKKLLYSDILLEDPFNSIPEIHKIEEISKELLDYLYKISDIKTQWNNYNLWLLINVYLNFWYNFFQLFNKEELKNIILQMDENWEEIQKFINKWRTDFPIEFIIGSSFLSFKTKSEILDYIKILNQRFENTRYTSFIERLTDVILTGDTTPEIFNIPVESYEIKLCLILLFLNFGNLEFLIMSVKWLTPIIKDTLKKIIKNKNRIEVGSYIRDWLCAKYVQLKILKNIESLNIIQVDELPYFSLSARKFERLIFWITKTKSNYKNVQWRGATGSEKGKDILAQKLENNRLWVIQAKRVKKFGPSALEKEFLKVLPELETYNSEGYVIYIAKNATDELRKTGEKLTQRHGYQVEIKDCGDIDFIVKQNPILLKEFFNYK